jgi:hypothetical protein
MADPTTADVKANALAKEDTQVKSVGRKTAGHYKELVYVARKDFMEKLIASKIQLPQELQDALKKEQEAVQAFVNALRRQQAAQDRAAKTV